MQSEVKLKVRDIINENVNLTIPIEKVEDDVDLTNLGMDYNGYIKAIVVIEREFGFEFDDEGLNFENHRTLDNLISYIESRIKSIHETLNKSKNKVNKRSYTITVNEKKINYTPQEVGYLPEKICEIDKHLKELINSDKIVSAGYIMSRNNKVFAHRAMGSLRYDINENNFQPNSTRRIASLTKLFTSISIMQLVEQGKLYLKQPVKTIIKEFDRDIFRQISIFHLLTHTSGICPTPGSLNEPYPVSLDIFENENWIKEGLRGYIYAEPGQCWAYSSFGYMVLGEIISRVSGIEYEQYVINNILKPLGLKNTFFDVPNELIDKVCITDKHSEKLLYNSQKGKSEKSKSSPPRSNSGLYSTLEDMQILGQMFLNQGTYNGTRILSRKTVESMTKNHLDNLKSYSFDDNGMKREYGLGFWLYSDELLTPGVFGHEGTGLSGIFIDSVEKFVLVYFCNLPLPVWLPEADINLRNLAWSGIV